MDDSPTSSSRQSMGHGRGTQTDRGIVEDLDAYSANGPPPVPATALDTSHL